MSRFEGTLAVKNNAGSQTLATVAISKNTWTEVKDVVNTAINNGLTGAQNSLADWQGAQNDINL